MQERFAAATEGKTYDFIVSSDRYLVDPASSHMLVSKIKPCMCKHKPKYGKAANGSLQQPLFI